MKTITSKDNPVYKSACRLTRKKYRDDARHVSDRRR